MPVPGLKGPLFGAGGRGSGASNFDLFTTDTRANWSVVQNAEQNSTFTWNAAGYVRSYCEYNGAAGNSGKAQFNIPGANPGNFNGGDPSGARWHFLGKVRFPNNPDEIGIGMAQDMGDFCFLAPTQSGSLQVCTATSQSDDGSSDPFPTGLGTISVSSWYWLRFWKNAAGIIVFGKMWLDGSPEPAATHLTWSLSGQPHFSSETNLKYPGWCVQTGGGTGSIEIDELYWNWSGEWIES